MGALIVQLAARGTRGGELARSSGQALAIGRAWSNDVVLADPYVAPLQARLSCDAEGWSLTVLDRTNPVMLDGVPVVDDTVRIASGARLTVGRTDLLLFDASHPVEPTRKILLSSWLAPGRVGPLLAFGVLGLVCGIDVVSEYLQSSVDLEWKPYAYAGLFSAAVSILWAGGWSLAGRILRHQPHFLAQLLVTALVSVALTFIYPGADYLEFMTGSVTVGRIANYGIALVSLAVLLKMNLLFATNLRHTTRVALGVSTMVVALVFAGNRYAEDEFEPEPVYSAVVKPPFAHLGSERSIDAFLAQAATAVATMDDEREQER